MFMCSLKFHFPKKHLSAPICLLPLPAAGSHARWRLTWAAMWAPHRSVGVARTTAFGMTCGWSVYNRNVNMKMGREVIFTKPAEAKTECLRLLFFSCLWFGANINGEISKFSWSSSPDLHLFLFSYFSKLDQYGSAWEEGELQLLKNTQLANNPEPLCFKSNHQWQTCMWPGTLQIQWRWGAQGGFFHICMQYSVVPSTFTASLNNVWDSPSGYEISCMPHTLWLLCLDEILPVVFLFHCTTVINCTPADWCMITYRTVFFNIIICVINLMRLPQLSRQSEIWLCLFRWHSQFDIVSSLPSHSTHPSPPF